MGLVYAEIQLSNPRNAELKPLVTKALVGTGAIALCVPEHIMVHFSLEEVEKREVTKADGKHMPVPYVDPIQIEFENRTCFTGALVLGDSVLLGAVPMEDMDLVVSSRIQKLTVNPESQNIPSAVVKLVECQGKYA